MKLFKRGLFLSFLLSALMMANAQTVKMYETEWKRINELVEKKALPRTTLEEVKKLYALAKKEGQDAQVIKALVYMVNLQMENREGADKAAILEIEKEIGTQKEPAVSLLKNLLASLYWQYFQQHRWQLYNRTATTNFVKDDIATWGTEDFHKRITELFLQSISNKALLQATKLEAYEAIIQKGNTRHLRPTLYDLLAHTSLGYFRTGERSIKKPAYAFEINNPKAFAPAAEFVATTFSTNDSLSLEHKALTIYQELIRFHLKDAKKDALIDVDIDRLQFVHGVATVVDKDELYTNALRKLYDTYGIAASRAGYLLAVQYHNLAAGYHPLKDTTNRFARIKAVEILRAIVKDSAVKSEAWANSYNLLQDLERPTFSFELEKVSVPDQPFRALVRYKAVPALHFRLIKLTEGLKRSAREDQQDWWSQLLKATALRTWQQPLPLTADLQEHSVEIKLDALPIGEYILLANSSEQPTTKSALGAQAFHVSNISWVNSGDGFYVLNRESGQPLEGAAVQVYNQTYNYSTSRYSKTKLGDYKTDRTGFFALTQKGEAANRGYFLEVSHSKDHLFLDDILYSHRSYNEQQLPKTKEAPKIFFFTDRSIYRPGQTVHFKGIVAEKEGAASNIVNGHKATLYLRNANYTVTDSLQLTTNEFGSFNGRFTLPQGVLNGYFQITDKSSRNAVSFSVEEYKRPKFYVEFAKVKDTYKAGDTVRITGSAKAYAGNNIDGAKVSYRVVRQPRFMYPWLAWRWWQPQAEPMEITHGTVTTNESGTFTITFAALPDRKIDPKLEPIFDYRIYADVTDAAGETRSSETTVSAGYKSLLLTASLPEQLPVDSLKKIVIRTENMAGEYQSARVSIKAYELIPEPRLVRARYWQQPDQFVMTKPEFIALFPHDEYYNESDPKTWAAGALAFSTSDTTTITGAFTLSGIALKPGNYRFEFTTTDREGREVKDVRYIELYDPKTKSLTRPSYLWTKGPAPIEPGERTSVQVASSAADVYLIHSIDKGGQQKADSKPVTELVRLSNEKKTFDFTASESDRGGYGVTYAFVKHNRFYQYSNVISVPWSNKELGIEYTTFRDKTLPGAEEKWTVKISGYKGEKAAAEMLASMYDASLDQFKPHSWNHPSLYPYYRQRMHWQGVQNFAPVQSIEKWIAQENKDFSKRYDQFLWAGGNGLLTRALQGKASGMYIQRSNLEEVVVTGMATRNKREVAAAAPTAVQAEGVANDMDASSSSADTAVTPQKVADNTAVQIRKNFNETAFFFSDLRTDKDGNISFSFTTPEALTRWKLQTLAHTKELAFGMATKELVTQKELMVQPAAPRFLRQGDRLEFSAKIVNLSGKELTGQAELQLIDAATGQSVDGWFMNTFPNQYFTMAPGASEVVKFPMEVPFLFTSSLIWRVIAKSGNLSDGEEQAIPVLTNKVLVTETVSMPIRGSGTKTFTLPNLLNTTSETLTNHSLTVEYTANPAWYAVQALPYLAEQKNESVEQTWNRYYANALAASIVASAPRIKEIMARWKSMDTAALLSNLQKNQELKSALLEETPWVLQAKSETEQKKNIALLFDMVRMNAELTASFQKLKAMQSSNGGFVWFKGSPEDRYMTQYILTGIGHLKKLGALPAEQRDGINAVVIGGLLYLDRRIKQDHDNLIKSKATPKTAGVDHFAVQYLYMRSFFTEFEVAPVFQTAYKFYRSAAAQNWTKGSKYTQGMTALALYRTGEKTTPQAILRSLKETAIVHEELGMYWKDNAFGYSWWWWQAPIETQSLLIEAFHEISNDTRAVDDLRTWLIKNKQTTAWKTSKATADACYAMLLRGTDWLNSEPVVAIKLGTAMINNTSQKGEAGTGYFKQTIEPRNIKPEMGKITVTVQQPSNPTSEQPLTTPSWGAVYWQYFEDMDKVGSAATPLKLAKKLFVEKNSDKGPVLTPVNDGDALHVGDKIKVRIELRVDRDMEYVHMKDLRASALEPVNVLSGYKWQGGLGYYESTKDASTGFFFNYLRKGTYVFEYPLFVTHTGNFSAGITTIQSLYAPEFSAHSEGVRINVE